MSETIQQKLTQLRVLMKERGLDFYYVPSGDAHNNEYVPKPWQRRAWISGFTGSAGSALIGLEKAYLWTDSRYFLQAEQELDKNLFELMPQIPGKPRPDQWLLSQKSPLKIGVDPKVMTIFEAERWQKTLAENGSALIPISDNLIDQIWENQPQLETHPLLLLEMEYTGETATSKINRIADALKTLGVKNHVISALDAIAWLFNIRGTDIEFNPLVISYAIIEASNRENTIDVTLYLNTAILSARDKEYFSSHHVQLKSYSDFSVDLAKLSGKTLVDPALSSFWVLHELKNAEIIFQASPITLMKACKNPVEQNGMREAHRRDALAMCQFLYWLENNWQGATEISAAEKVNAFRRTDKYCQDLSFTTISGYGDHGAIIHYSVDENSNRALGNDSLYLVDSGGQYLQGTTDITRTVHLGTPTQTQKNHYTMVLKGHLALGRAKFPAGTTGDQLNVLAHYALWQEGLDFAHGTGHGVGCYLCVHEGPQSISSYPSGIALQPGMAVSNEPGLYLPGEYGIRIENVCLITEAISAEKSLTGHGPFYQLSDLTLVPYEKNLIEINNLSSQEIKWTNEYHAQIYQTLAPDLPKEVAEWLHEKTKSL